MREVCRKVYLCRMRRLWHAANATVLSILVAILTLELLPRIAYLEQFIDPIMDWDFTDHYYDNFNYQEVKADTSFVIVNIGMLNRSRIADLIQKLNKESPRAIGLSVYFEQRRDTIGDIELKRALDSVENLVLIKGFNFADIKDSVIRTHPYFTNNAIISYSGIQSDNLGIKRQIEPKVIVEGDSLWHFSIELASFIDPSIKETISKRNKEIEFIKFYGNEFNFSTVEYGLRDYSFVRDKVVILGFLGESIHEFSFEDNYFTPLKIEVGGNRIPDMYACIIHANSLKMLLSKDFINYSRYLDLYGALILCFIIMIGYMYLHNNTNHFLFLSRITSLAMIVLLIWGTLTVFTFSSFKFDISIVVLFLLVGSDIYEFYDRYYQNRVDKLRKRSRRRVYSVFLLFLTVLLMAIFFRASLVFRLVSLSLVIYFVILRALLWKAEVASLKNSDNL